MNLPERKILIAEDNQTSLLVLESVLKQWGYGVIAARDGYEAWAIMKADNSPQIAVLDWVMPGLDGLEICRRARQMNDRLPFYIILLTAQGRKEDIVDGLEAGANDYITKPFDRAELRARLHVGERVIELQSALAHRARELEEALSHINTLQGILPICMHCHKIFNDQKSWQRIEQYIEEHSDAHFSHGLCPECLVKHYPEVRN
jgi:sigma-B regulation protein RsbU (phosphoserine phosphatase)